MDSPRLLHALHCYSSVNWKCFRIGRGRASTAEEDVGLLHRHPGSRCSCLLAAVPWLPLGYSVVVELRRAFSRMKGVWLEADLSSVSLC